MNAHTFEDANHASGPSDPEAILRDIVHRLRGFALQDFDRNGPQSPRGAAIWDSAAYIAETYAPKFLGKEL